jgi:Uma2 family endonuclease
MIARANMPFIVRASTTLDPTIYPVDEKVGENLLQRRIVELLRPLVERWLRSRRVKALVGADQFVYCQQHNSTARVSPDVYVLPGIDPDVLIGSWKVWETGIVPSFALEIVSKDWEKDYVDTPERHREIGTTELVIFDPGPDTHADGVRWQVYRRVRDRPLAAIEASQGDRVRSRTLGCFLRCVGTGAALRLRLATVPDGAVLFPTQEEVERAAKETALARVAELEAKLGRRKRSRAK